MAKCSVSRCRSEVRARGWCVKHWTRWQRTGTVEDNPNYVYGRGCLVEGCNNKHDARGYCQKHRKRWAKYGDPLGGSKFYAAHGEPDKFIEKAVNWKSNRCLIWPYSRDNHGRARIAVNGRPQQASRIVCEKAHGAPPTPKHEAAHNCGRGHLGCVNNKHLEWKTHAENQADMIGHNSWGNQTRKREVTNV